MSVGVNRGLPAQSIGGGHGIIGYDSFGKPVTKGENNEHFVNSASHEQLHNGHNSNGSGVAAVEESPEIDIIINNVVCTFSVRCHLNLKKIAMEGCHVEYKRENGMLNMKLRRPNATATIWSSGKITCTGSTSEMEAKVAARRIARRLQKLGYNIRFQKYRVVNVLGTCSFPFGIKLNQFSSEHKAQSCYEPELHPGVTYRIKEPRATLKVFSTGSITVTAPCVANVQSAIEHIYPLVSQFKMESSKINKKASIADKKYLQKKGIIVSNPLLNMVEDDEDEYYDDEEGFSDDFDSDASCD